MKYIFIHKKNQDVTSNISEFLKENDSFDSIDLQTNSYFLYSRKRSEIYRDKNTLISVSGYVRIASGQNSNTHNQGIGLKVVGKEWPLGEECRGSFSILTISGNEVNIANDPIGIYPIYYISNDYFTLISTHLSYISYFINFNLDKVGVIERLMGPDFCNFGYRTIFEGVSRLLGGEFISFDIAKNKISRKYDNSLFGGEYFSGDKKTIINNYWNKIKVAVNSSVEYVDDKAIGLSGGLDSRITLAALSSKNYKNIKSIFYGKENTYEANIAMECAQQIKSEFRAFPIDDFQFPNITSNIRYVKGSEAVGCNCWLPIIDSNYLKSNSTFLLGDLLSSLLGRSYEGKNRVVRIKNFLLRKNIFKKFNSESYDNWKENKIKFYIDRLNQNDVVFFKVDYELVKKKIIEDLSILFMRIESHKFSYIEECDELFNWYTHNRFLMSKQVLLLNDKYNCISPLMDMSIVRLSTKIHPRNKLYGQIPQQIFNLEENRGWDIIPEVQSPGIPFRYNNIRMVVWGIRSLLDQFLIKRFMRKKNFKLRYRYMNGIHWPNIYKNNLEENLKNTASCFNNDWINKSEKIIDTINNRAALDEWPLSTMDIASIVGLNLEIEIMKKNAH